MKSAEESAAEEAGWTAMGQHLRQLRGSLRQEDLAELSGVSVPTIRAIENHREGKRHSPRILKKLSHALGKPDDYLSNYVKNPPPEEPGGEPAPVIIAPPRSELDEILVARLSEMVVPRLANIEKEVHAIKDVIYNTGRNVEINLKHDDDGEQPPPA